MALYDDILREANRAGRAATQMGSEIASDPLAFAGTVVPPLPPHWLERKVERWPEDSRTINNYKPMPLPYDRSGAPQYYEPMPLPYDSYNPAGAYAEAGRTLPNRVSEQAMAMNQLSQPQGGVPSDLHNWNDPYGRPTGYDYGSMPSTGDVLGASVVAPPRMPTEKETLDRGVMGPANERDAAFSKIHGAYYTGADFGYEQGWPERLGVPTEYIDLYMAVPDEAKQYAHDNPTDAILQQFEEKYGFPLDVSIEISM